jgi:hypothetical protein
VVGGDVGTVLAAEQVLQEDLEAEGQLRGALDRVEPIDLVRRVTDLQCTFRAEAVHDLHDLLLSSFPSCPHAGRLIRAPPTIYLDVKIHSSRRRR